MALAHIYDDICGITAAMPGVKVPALPAHLCPNDSVSVQQQRNGIYGMFGNRRYMGNTVNLSQAQISFYEYMSHKLVAVGLASNE